jgi:hypothetical protein
LRVVRRSEFSAAGNPVVEGLPREIQVKTSPIAKDGGKIELNVANMNTPTGVFTFYARVPVKQKRLRNAKAIAVAEAEATRFEQLVSETSEQAASVTEAEKPQADRRVQEAKRLKAEADKRVKEIREANKEREYTFELISTPVRLRIHDTPVRLSTEGGEIFLKKGGKVAAALSVERRFGFDDKVDVALGTSSKVPGLTVPQVTIVKGESTGLLELTANDQPRPGRYNIPLVGRLRFNNLNLEAKSVLTVRIEE